MLKYADVVGYEDYFMACSNGDIFSKRTNKILKQTTLKSGYATIATKIGGRQGKNICFRVHRLIALTFIPNPNNKDFVNHIDGNKLNNNVDNLEWATPSENTIHAVKTGLLVLPKGHEVSTAKLTKEQVLQIRSLAGKYTIRDLGKMYNINHASISRIINNKMYI